MKLLFATADLVREGRSFEGFPLLLDADMLPVEPAQSYLWDVLVEGGSVTSKLTWEHYGRWLYDFFSFLEHNQLKWDERAQVRAANVVSRYRQWALSEMHNSARTVNLRVGLVVRFYQWARKEGFIDHVPITYRAARSQHTGMLAHLQSGEREAVAAKVREFKVPPKILTLEQIRACRLALTHPSHKLLFELMLQVGLRSAEARTFPLEYVFNPRGRKDLSETTGTHLAVELNPRDMELKYGKRRVVHVPWRLMEDMHGYVLHKRSGYLAQGTHPDQRQLIINAVGEPYGKDSTIDVFETLEARVGFHVRPHMLRHSYATHVLRMLRANPKFEGEPLLYVRDRLGHSDVQTTAVYLHLLNALEAQAVLAHEDYVDDLFARALPELGAN